MGFLARRRDVPTDDPLGLDPLRLPSRAELPRAARAAAAEAMGQERARTMVQLTRLQGLDQVGGAAIAVTTHNSARAEQAARMFPEERARVDAVADTIAAACMRLVQEIGQ